MTSSSSVSCSARPRFSSASKLLCECHQLVEEGLDVDRPGVVLVDHLLELFQEVDPGPVHLHHPRQLERELRPELLHFDGFAAPLELLSQRLEIDLAEIDVSARVVDTGGIT